MKAHDGLTVKAIKADKLDEDTVALIEDFAKIDSASRIIDEVIYEKYISLLGKKGWWNMITKILISLLKKNKIQLETESSAWKFNIALVLESLLGSFCASVGLNMVLDYFVFHRVDNFNIFGLVTLLYGIANMKILFNLFIRSKGTDPWDWKSELTEKYYTANEILKRKDDYIVSFRPNSLSKIFYYISKNGLIYRSGNIKTVGIRTSDNLIDFIKVKKSFPYTEIEEIDITYEVSSPYIKNSIEKREASVILTLPDDYVEKLKAFIHKDDNKEQDE